MVDYMVKKQNVRITQYKSYVSLCSTQTMFKLTNLKENTVSLACKYAGKKMVDYIVKKKNVSNTGMQLV